MPRRNNVALRTVDTEFVALLNNDAVPDPLWLKSLVEALEEHPQAGLAASKMLLYDRREIIDRAGDGYTMNGHTEFLDLKVNRNSSPGDEIKLNG